MDNQFFERPILNSPYSYPERHWELDSEGQPTQKIIETRRKAEFITPIPKPKKQKQKQDTLVFDEGKGLSTEKQLYDPTRLLIPQFFWQAVGRQHRVGAQAQHCSQASQHSED